MGGKRRDGECGGELGEEHRRRGGNGGETEVGRDAGASGKVEKARDTRGAGKAQRHQ